MKNLYLKISILLLLQLWSTAVGAQIEKGTWMATGKSTMYPAPFRFSIQGDVGYMLSNRLMVIPSLKNSYIDFSKFALNDLNFGLEARYYCLKPDRGGSFADGANYVLATLRNNPTEFPVSQIKFEVKAGSRREIDLELITPNGTKIRYEFKSYQWTSLPPSDFARQFSEDLRAVDDVAELRWYFDAKKLVGKTEAELETYMLNEVRKLRIGPDIDPDQLKKLTLKDPGTIEDLIAILKSRKVFQVK